MSNYIQTSYRANDYNSEIFPFVIVAHISAALYDAQLEAKKLSLTAKNARTLAFRAGEQAAGFKVITNYIDEFAQLIIRYANKIQNLSVDISNYASQMSFANDYCLRVDEAKRLLADDAEIAMLENQLIRYKELLQVAKSNFAQSTANLWLILEDIDEQMRAANFIALTAKVEAVAAPEFVHGLNNVAVSIADIAAAIQQSTKHCFQCLVAHRESDYAIS